jgi:hypothetical protein
MNGLATKIRRKIVLGREYLNVRGVAYFAQRRVRTARARQRLSNLVARFLPPPGRVEKSVEAKALDSRGFAFIDGVVTREMAAEMRGYLARQPVFAPYLLNSPLVSIDAPHLPDSHTLFIPEDKVIGCPHLLDVANHPTILAAVEGIFGCKPTVGVMCAWWSIPTADGKPRHAENFHRDFDDVNFIKLFIYMTDVGPENGPHEYIEGSHQVPLMCEIRRFTDDEVVANFPASPKMSFVGSAGTMFLENTYGLHRGLPVRKDRRLILQIIYSMLPIVDGPVRPYPRASFAPTRDAVDPYVNRVYLARA